MTTTTLHIAACIAPRFRDLVPDADTYWIRIAALQKAHGNSGKPATTGTQWNFRGRPKRADELLPGGSLYVIAGGRYAARLPIVAIRKHWRRSAIECDLLRAVPVVQEKRRGFRGFRYLEPDEAPADLQDKAGAAAVDAELQALGLN